MTGGTLLAIDIRYEQDVVLTRQRARQVASLLGLGPPDQTAFATAVSELARNAFQYAGHGRVTLRRPRRRRPARRPPGAGSCSVQDHGPGIADLATVLARAGTARATGLGLGLLGAKRLNDEFDVQLGPRPRARRSRSASALPPGLAGNRRPWS